ncbi:hypothetical protein [Gloeothece verrucosa]|uniref:Uncharacterized protein n=1 Tax=Gloeothece verrucosa (strain PCC 7822) TaxID=497965 RepID=E0UGB9_GLOV7|nr:hypothetical protein [Gloeothece verrucosa]ADN16738.1 conserved hypothetical protein [Gloeothece verrucosa PCC 7822]
MDEIIKKIAGLGLPGILLVIAIAASGGSSAAAIALIAGLGGPLGIIGGLGLLGLAGVIAEEVTAFGIDAILKNIYTERSKTESVRVLLKEIQDLPITDDLKLKLKHELSPRTVDPTEPEPTPKTIEIIEE